MAQRHRRAKIAMLGLARFAFGWSALLKQYTISVGIPGHLFNGRAGRFALKLCRGLCRFDATVVSSNGDFCPSAIRFGEFPHGSPLAVLDEIGHDLPSLLHDAGFRDHARRLTIPPWTEPADPTQRLPQLRLYYVRLGFLASGYINQVGAAAGDAAAARILRCRCAMSAAGCRGRRFSATTATRSTTGSDSIPPARSRWAISTRCKTSSISTTSIGSSWCMSKSKPIAAEILAAIDERPAALAAGDAAAVNEVAANDRRSGVAASGRAAADSREDGPGAVLQNVSAVYPLLRARGL